MIDLKKDVVEARMAKRRLKEKKSETDGWVLVFSGDYSSMLGLVMFVVGE